MSNVNPVFNLEGWINAIYPPKPKPVVSAEQDHDEWLSLTASEFWEA